MTARRVLLVSPAFHGYHAAIAASLEARGHTVVTHIYDDHATVTGRLRHQLRHQLPSKIGVGSHDALRGEQAAGALAAARDARPEAVVVVKGDTLADAFWQHLDDAGLPRITWLYDEVRRTQFTSEQLSAIGPLATYSPLDHQAFTGHGWDSRHLPLAFDHRLVPEPSASRRREVTFVGARYPNREEALEALCAAGVPTHAYGRDWSGHPIDRLRTWSLRRPAVPGSRDLDRPSAYRVMAESTATLNLHGDQDGFTMRTFEAAGVGGLQLIDRTDGGDLYDDGVEVVSFSDLDELVELCRRAGTDPLWSEGIRRAGRARTLAQHTFDHRVETLEASWDTV